MNEHLLKQYEEEGNFALAFEVLKSLAENSREYQLQLAYYYEKGLGTEKDERKRWNWSERCITTAPPHLTPIYGKTRPFNLQIITIEA